MKKLESERDHKRTTLIELEETPVKDLWRHDLDIFVAEWNVNRIQICVFRRSTEAEANRSLHKIENRN